MQRFYRFLLPGILLIWTGMAIAQTPASTTFHTNHVRAVVNANGALFTDFQQGQFVPIQPGLAEKTLLRGSGIWAASIDPAGNLRGAIVAGHQSDFQPGLLNAGPNYIWRVNRADINAHLADFQDNGHIDDPNPAVFAWPGSGNPNTGFHIPYTVQGLAGYDDTNDNGLYTPFTGDYPTVEIRGCPPDNYPEDMGWFVNNDLGDQPHPSGLQALQLEVQTQVFAYHVQPAASVLNNALYVRYKIINRGSETISPIYVGLYNDFSIGNAEDDFAGINPDRSLMYAYNGDTNDEGGFGADVPVMAVDLMRGPLDTFGEEITLRHFVVLENVEGLQGLDFYRILTGHFPDGTLAPNGGLMYPGNPNNAPETSEVFMGNTPGHRIGVGSFGPFTLNPGAVNDFFVAYYYVYTPGLTPLQNVQSLYDQDESIAQYFFSSCFANLTNANEEVPGPDHVASDLRLYPSPTIGAFTIESQGQLFRRIEVLDQLGRSIQRTELDQATQKYTVTTSGWPAGMYVVRVDGQVKTVVVQR